MRADTPRPKAHGCERKRVATGGLGSIDACDCGMLHVHIGAFTVRLERAALGELARMIDDALDGGAKDVGSETQWRASPARGEA